MSTPYPGDRLWRPWLAARLAALAAIALALVLPAIAQGGGEATPIRANLVTRTPEGAGARAPTITPSVTPSPLPAARLQALESAGDVNVRALPDIESDLLGTIASGTIYQVVRRYYRWYELRYDPSPNGRAWVYGDLVTIEGDAARIEVIDTLDAVVAANSLNAADNAGQAGRNPQTVEIATLAADGAVSLEVVDATPLPTYTPPPTRSPRVDQLEVVEAADPRLLNLPPLAPILALAALGAVGLLISLIRG